MPCQCLMRQLGYLGRAAGDLRRRDPQQHALHFRQPRRNPHRTVSGRINLGQEGTLVMGAMAGFGVSYLTVSTFRRSETRWAHGSACWRRGWPRAVLGVLHAWLCSQPRVNDIAVGIGIMLFGTGLAFYLGKPFVEPSAPAVARDQLRMVESFRAGAGGAADQLAVLHRRRAGAADDLVAQEHALGLDRPHRRREHRCRPGHGIFGQRRPPVRDDGRGIPCRRRRVVSLALLAGKLE